MPAVGPATTPTRASWPTSLGMERPTSSALLRTAYGLLRPRRERTRRQSNFSFQVPVPTHSRLRWGCFTEVDGNAIGRRHYRIPVAWQSREALRLGRLVARPKRFELLTPRFVVWCSIQLSYGRVLRIAREMSPNRANPPGTRL